MWPCVLLDMHMIGELRQPMPTPYADDLCRQPLPTTYADNLCRQAVPTGCHRDPIRDNEKIQPPLQMVQKHPPEGMPTTYAGTPMPTTYADDLCRHPMPTTYADAPPRCKHQGIPTSAVSELAKPVPAFPLQRRPSTPSASPSLRLSNKWPTSSPPGCADTY